MWRNLDFSGFGFQRDLDFNILWGLFSQAAWVALGLVSNRNIQIYWCASIPFTTYFHFHCSDHYYYFLSQENIRLTPSELSGQGESVAHNCSFWGAILSRFHLYLTHGSALVLILISMCWAACLNANSWTVSPEITIQGCRWGGGLKMSEFLLLGIAQDSDSGSPWEHTSQSTDRDSPHGPTIREGRSQWYGACAGTTRMVSWWWRARPNEQEGWEHQTGAMLSSRTLQTPSSQRTGAGAL